MNSRTWNAASGTRTSLEQRCAPRAGAWRGPTRSPPPDPDARHTPQRRPRCPAHQTAPFPYRGRTPPGSSPVPGTPPTAQRTHQRKRLYRPDLSEQHLTDRSPRHPTRKGQSRACSFFRAMNRAGRAGCCGSKLSPRLRARPLPGSGEAAAVPRTSGVQRQNTG